MSSGVLSKNEVRASARQNYGERRGPQSDEADEGSSSSSQCVGRPPGLKMALVEMVVVLCVCAVCVCVCLATYEDGGRTADHQASVYRTSTSFRLGSLALRSSYVSAVSLVLFMFRLQRLFMELRASSPASVTGVSHRLRT